MRSNVQLINMTQLQNSRQPENTLTIVEKFHEQVFSYFFMKCPSKKSNFHVWYTIISTSFFFTKNTRTLWIKNFEAFSKSLIKIDCTPSKYLNTKIISVHRTHTIKVNEFPEMSSTLWIKKNNFKQILIDSLSHVSRHWRDA